MSPDALVDPIPVETLRHEIRTTITDWRQEVVAEPQRFNNRFYQGLLVLSYCRAVHDLVRGAVGSKRATSYIEMRLRRMAMCGMQGEVDWLKRYCATVARE